MMRGLDYYIKGNRNGYSSLSTAFKTVVPRWVREGL